VTKVVAAAVQCSPVLYSCAGTVDKICSWIADLAGQGVEIAVFAETLVPYYPYFSFIQAPYAMGAEHLRLMRESVEVPSRFTDQIAAAAKSAGMVVSIGVNEKAGHSLYNAQLLFDADGTMVQHRRKITPTYHERMVWGQGDGSGLCAVDTRVGRIGSLACWEHYNPLARYALMADHEQIHVAMFPGSLVGEIFAEQIEVTIRHHALESGCFVVNATAWLSPEQQQQTRIQAQGVRWLQPSELGLARVGGAGPTDHKAFTFHSQTSMIPVLSDQVKQSPFSAKPDEVTREVVIFEKDIPIGRASIPGRPRFYDGTTRDGIPYWQIATLHSKDVLATTVLQTCVRYRNRNTSCQFCAIEESLKAGKTIAHKTPQQLAEVAKVVVELDGVKQMIMTTGTPKTLDRGAAVLVESARAVRAAVDIPIQVQCEPPDSDVWFQRLKDAGVDALGMHLEAVTDRVRNAIMPGKARIPMSHYLTAFKAAVEVFGKGNVSTYILAGLGDSEDEIIAMSLQLIELGVYPFVVPFVPVAGTPLASHPLPDATMLERIFSALGPELYRKGIVSDSLKAGCAKCGACSALKSYEKEKQQEQEQEQEILYA
jgi:radical SAM protein (TIGR04043 family)